MAARDLSLPPNDGEKNWDAELTQAHQSVAKIAKELYDDVDHIFRVDTAKAQKQAIRIGNALERVAHAERACRRGHEIKRERIKHDEAMLEHERLAYIDFEQLSNELESDSPDHNHVAALAVDISHHMNLAEEAHAGIVADKSEKPERS